MLGQRILLRCFGAPPPGRIEGGGGVLVNGPFLNGGLPGTWVVPNSDILPPRPRRGHRGRGFWSPKLRPPHFPPT